MINSMNYATVVGMMFVGDIPARCSGCGAVPVGSEWVCPCGVGIVCLKTYPTVPKRSSAEWAEIWSRFHQREGSPMANYSKSEKLKATVGEARQLAERGAVPALIAARFAIILSLIACVASAVAIATAIAVAK